MSRNILEKRRYLPRLKYFCKCLKVHSYNDLFYNIASISHCTICDFAKLRLKTKGKC